MSYNLLTHSNAKLDKSHNDDWYVVGLHLAPGNLSGREVCGGRDECFDSCLHYAGHGGFDRTQQARIRRTKLFFEQRETFMRLLIEDVTRAYGKATLADQRLAVRLNITSDIPWESIRAGDFENIMAVFPQVMFYDYTKLFGRKKLPQNYHLTFSRGSDNTLSVHKALAHGMNVAVVFDTLPAKYYGRPVINGDEHDLRFLDPEGCIVGLTPKGPAKKADGTFVLRLQR